MNTPPRKESETGLYAPVWRKINQLIDYMREISVVNGRDVRVSRTMNGTLLLGSATVQGSGSTLKHYRVKSIEGDFMTCREYDGTTEGATDIYIARDPELRRSRFEGQSIAYNSDGDSFTATYTYSSNTKRVKTVSGVAETQVIVPYYKTDFTVILAAESENKSGVTDPDENDIYLVEVTQRAWAKLE